MATNSIPIGSIGFEVYSADERLLGVASVTLPELSLQTIEVAGSGLSGTIDWPAYSQFENLELTLQFRTVFDKLTELLSPNAHMLTLRTALEKYDAASGERNVHGLKIVCRGLTKNLNLGNLETGESADAELVMHLDYIKLEDSVDGVLLEIDKFNHKFEISGYDWFEVINDALGL